MDEQTKSELKGLLQAIVEADNALKTSRKALLDFCNTRLPQPLANADMKVQVDGRLLSLHVSDGPSGEPAYIGCTIWNEATLKL